MGTTCCGYKLGEHLWVPSSCGYKLDEHLWVPSSCGYHMLWVQAGQTSVGTTHCGYPVQVGTTCCEHLVSVGTQFLWVKAGQTPDTEGPKASARCVDASAVHPLLPDQSACACSFLCSELFCFLA